MAKGKAKRPTREEFTVTGEELVKRVKALLREGNARRIVVKKASGETVVEFPLTVGAVGAVLVPMLAALGALAALLGSCTIVVERR
jgi:hypothetical protein